jgi:hypothetical protein
LVDRPASILFAGHIADAPPAFVRAEGPLGTHDVELSKSRIAKR